MNNNSTENSVLLKQLLVLEIGTEEIPARFFPDTMTRLQGNAEKIFSDFRFSFSSLRVLATPRRITLFAEIDAQQGALEKEVWGPPVTVAFDADGMPTKAADAFAKNQGQNVEDLVRKDKGKGSYVVAIVKESAQSTAELLPDVLTKIILSLSFPKSMRWGHGTIRFCRPIIWIFALYNNERIRFEIDGIKSTNATRGHRFLSPATFEIRDCRAYINLLRNNFVILNPKERAKIILDGARKLASTVNAIFIEDEKLLEHVTFLVEYPVAVLCSFPAEYLTLPKELLITVMKDHQKYFALEDELGNPSNYFIVISNTKYDNAETVRKGAEKVIKARFEDARFYFEHDKKIAAQSRLEGLKKVIFQDKLGSLYDKTLRILSLSESIALSCCPAYKEDVGAAAMLSKNDLISGVVREFPELQGIMASYYAVHEKQKPQVAEALREQYLPAHSGGVLPDSDVGAVLSLSDKLDTVASFFCAGLIPTGTEDPFALRRQTIGILSILISKRYPLIVTNLLRKALEPFSNGHEEKILEGLLSFFESRMEMVMASSGYPSDSIAAVIRFFRHSPPYALFEQADAIQRFRADDGYASLLLALKRVNNIAPTHQILLPSPDLFMQEEERAIYHAVHSINEQLEAFIRQCNYYDALALLKTLVEPIHAFFDKVLIMDNDPAIKNNRLSLIAMVQALGQKVADFSKLS